MSTSHGVLADALRGAMAWQQSGWPGTVQALESMPLPVDPDLLDLHDATPQDVSVHDVGFRQREHALISGFSHFADGTQHTVVLGSAVTDDGQLAPVVYFLGAAAVMGRDPDTRAPYTAALDRFDGVLIPDGAPVPAGVPASAVQRVPAEQIADMGRCIDLVRTMRFTLERKLMTDQIRDPSRTGYLLVDGDLTGLPTDDRTVGVVKTVNLKVAPPTVMRAVLTLQPGQRTSLFSATYGKDGQQPRHTWFLRLRPAALGDPAVGVVRVEAYLPACDAADVTADEISRWLLAERGRPGADVHNPILMVEVVEARMRAALPERAWLARLFPRR